MSKVRLLVLGVIHLQGRAHGYAVHRELLSWNVEAWTQVKPGSIYHALKQLHKEGKLLAEAPETSQEGPGRTQYTLTPAGHREFVDLLEAALVSMEMADLAVGVALMQALPRERVLERLTTQLAQTRLYLSRLEQMLPGFTDTHSAPHTPDLLALWRSSLGAMAQWSAGLIARLEAGEYVLAGEPRLSDQT
ncbi:MAG: PadR family transcriptional regulator [Candidatus Sericytochromatia bacterium]